MPAALLKPLPRENGRILLVDDERPLVHICAQHLIRMGFEVDGFTDPHAALTAFQKDPTRYAAALTDLTMPLMTGDQLASHLLALRPDLPIALCTGHNQDDALPHMAQGYFRARLRKPILKEVLAQTLRAFLASPPLSE
jgi:CheY-like chemotaxis protein